MYEFVQDFETLYTVFGFKPQLLNIDTNICGKKDHEMHKKLSLDAKIAAINLLIYSFTTVGMAPNVI